ncbi:MAG: endonuclease/exonuclease/phosphatase family protein [Prevotellaceae bacterium]|nr:endonuclease/exonuclease/phosphatase family protein [Prevotellaceae bacterium]
MILLRKIVKNLLKAFSIIVAICLLLSYLSVFISPAKFWIIAFFGLFFQVFLLLNIFFLIFWIITKKKFFIAHLIVLLLGIPYLGSFVQLRGKPDIINAKSIKIISYNIHTFNTTSGENSSKEIADFLNNESADIVCLQEFFTYIHKQPREEDFIRLLKNLPHNHILYNVVRTGKNSSSGLAIFSRFPIVGKGEFRFPKSSNGAIYADIDVNGKIIRVYNNHLQSNRFNLSKTLKEDKRMDELVDASSKIKAAFVKRSEQVERISDHIKSSPYPVAVCGDFNDTPVSYTYRTMKGELNDAFKTAGRGIPSTYRGFFPSFRIDYIFYDKSMKANNFEVLSDIEFSDHYPLMATLEL